MYILTKPSELVFNKKSLKQVSLGDKKNLKEPFLAPTAALVPVLVSTVSTIDDLVAILYISFISTNYIYSYLILLIE